MKNIGVLLAAILTMTQRSLLLTNLGAPGHPSRTPNMPHTGRHYRARAHAPNDGRWHMKFHRSRV